ncbi:hypothetical protein, partial [Actinomadura sp. BRA 177]|uniref:hypothetical protein n=1 Tax=Actinomadura sp. BRA 177 TaxID=2745202 RepID=UPI00159611BA
TRTQLPLSRSSRTAFSRSRTVTALRLAAIDVLVFAGVDEAEAQAVVRSGAGRYDVPAPPPAIRPQQVLRRLGRSGPLRRFRRGR